MAYLLGQPHASKAVNYVVYTDVFTAAQCDTIIDLHKTRPIELGTTENTISPVNHAIRTSRVIWLPWSAEVNWIYDKLATVAYDIRQNWFPFNLSGFEEDLQLTHYTAKDNGHYAAHKDMSSGRASVRKLSCVVLLNERSDFEGGDFEMLATSGSDKAVRELERGTLLAFPAWELHRVTVLTKGERWSLVSWISGPKFV